MDAIASARRRPLAVDAAWIVAMVVLALLPLFADISGALVMLTSAIGVVAGAAIALLRRVLPARFTPGVFVLTLIIGALVASTDHRSLALSWVGGVMLGLVATAAAQERLGNAP